MGAKERDLDHGYTWWISCGDSALTEPANHWLILTRKMTPDEVTVQNMKKALDNPSLGIKVIDVREPDEYEIAHVNGVPLVPLSQIQQRFTELDPNQQYYLHCKAGVRSLTALNFLRQQGFKYLKSVKGGITAWSEEIDSQVPRY